MSTPSDKAPESKSPEKPAPKESDAADQDEVEWPDVPDESSTKYGLPDYSNGYEGSDTADIPEDANTESEGVDGDDDDRHNTEINIYYLVAGQSLFEHDIASSAHPHAPAVAKPFHVVNDYECADGHDCGAETIFEPESLSMRCVFGKDGTENDYDIDGAVKVDNTNCFDRELFYNFKTMTLSAPKSSSSSYKYTAPLIWSLAMIGFGFMVTICFFLCRLYLRRSHYKQVQATKPAAHSIDDDLETEQLTATTHGRYDGGSTQ